MYSSRASKEAADTYTASKAGPSTDSTSRSSGYGTAGAPGTAYGNSSQGYSNGPSYSPPVAQAPAPTTTVTNNYSNSGGNSALTNMALGYMIGHATSQHDTVVVQQPAPAQSSQSSQASPQNGGFVAPDDRPTPSASQELPSSGSSLTLPGPAVGAISSASDGLVFRAFGWIVGFGLAVVVVLMISKAWTARKAKFAQKTNYRL
ncbi:hypothetical protein DEE69_24925 [Ralstonia insidiosa]|nr:hypothetical protein [Ralstonia insidiosa]MBA9939350.1 hypothetical protein [Ralstonia insidiosa]MBC9968120.1 hypothetical protein [Ralstonia insidiosa]MBX3904317.1 hypothetical protein [Ralstonia insidiosa]